MFPVFLNRHYRYSRQRHTRVERAHGAVVVGPCGVGRHRCGEGHAKTQFAGTKKMVKWPAWAGINVGVTAALLMCGTDGVAAEFRMSARGESLVRPAGFQETLEEIAPQEHLGVDNGFPPEVCGPCGGIEPSGGCGSGCYPDPYPGWLYWGSFEFLLWWQKGHDLPPLVTSSTAEAGADNVGALGAAGTRILFPKDTQLESGRPGGRLSVGAWFDPCRFSGMAARWFSLGESSVEYVQDSSAFPVLARPFFNVYRDAEDAFQVAYPGSTTGSISIGDRSRVHSGDVFYRRMLFQSGWRRLDLIAGYQFSRIDTELSIASSQTVTESGGSQAQGTVIQLVDSLDTENAFHAGEIGLWGTSDQGPITWQVLAKVGLGTMRQRTAIAGQTVTSVPGQTPMVTDQGLFALDSNSGVFERDVFAVSPEVALSGAYHLNQWIDLTFGYSFVLWNRVALPSDQLDRQVNPTQLTGELEGPAMPAFAESDTSYFAHGLHCGVRCVW